MFGLIKLAMPTQTKTAKTMMPSTSFQVVSGWIPLISRLPEILHLVRSEGREGVWRGFLEARKAAAEHEFHHVRGPVALFGDAQLGLFALFGSRARFEKVRPVDKHHHVGVLLDGAG